MPAASENSLQLFAQPGVEFDAGEQPRSESDLGEWHACRETWRPYPPRHSTSPHPAFSAAWFDDVARRRYARHGRWIPKLFEFGRHRGEQVLGLGDGLGVDWAQYALGGATLSHCSPNARALELVQRHFQTRGLNGQFQRGLLTALPYPSDSMDVVCLNGMSHPILAINEVVNEAFRVLKPGGKLLAALPAKYNAHFWQSFWFPWRRLFTDGPEDQGHYSVKRLNRLFRAFHQPRVMKRHLRRSDIPHVWRWMLLPVMERLMGRYLVVKTFKPLAARPALRQAA
jgi:SAM-dependent methyltransferase